MSSIPTWGEIEQQLVALSPELKAQPALVQIQRNTEDWGEVRPVSIYTNGFKSGDWVLVQDDEGQMETMSRANFLELQQAYAHSHDDAPVIVRPMLLDQPMLLAEFFLDEETERQLQADDIVQARPMSEAPLFDLTSSKPPLGVKPYRQWLEECGIISREHANPLQATQRCRDVEACILRTVASGWGVRAEHASEYREWLTLRGKL